MTEIQLNTELMTNMEIIDCLSRRGGTTVYSVKSTKSEQMYVLKHISVPESQRQVDALILTGAAADAEAAQAYYQQVVTDYQTELEQLEALANSPTLGSFRSYEIKPKEEGVGFDVYLLSEHRTTLEKYLAETDFTQSSAVNLAMDLCNALSELRAAGLVHRDVKPANIYLSAQGHFMLGDMGIAKIDGLKYCSMPEAMLSSYSAPELFNLMAEVNETVDLYAVGLILYRIYNGGHAPFEDEKTSAKAADKMRITGQELPAPMFADYEMAEIIRKACCFKAEERYQTPEEMKQALVDYMMRNQVGDDPITPPIVVDEAPMDLDAMDEEIEPVQFASTEDLDETFKESFSPDNDMLNALIESVHRDIENDYTSENHDEDNEDAPKPRKKKGGAAKWMPTVLAVILVLGLAAAAVWFFFIHKDTITVDAIEITDRTVDSITVSLTTQENPEKFQVICTDAYGNVARQDYVPGQPNTFTGLASGAQYTFSVEGFNEEIIGGVIQHNASTMAMTNIISFSVSRETVSEIEVTFIPDSAEPEEWSISYGPVGGAPLTKVFTGHSVVLTGLDPDTEYGITLLDPADFHLTGATTTTGHTLSSVTVTGVNAIPDKSAVTISWDFEGEAPASWNVTTTGTEGYTDSQTVLENSVYLDNLRGGESYNIIITCDNMISGASATYAPNALEIMEIIGKPNEDGGIDVSWVCEADSEDTEWIVIYSLNGSDSISAVEQTTDHQVTLTGLIPGSTYHIEIQEANGEEVGGETTIDVPMPAVESFTDYGFTKGYVVMWLRPDQEDWTANNLQYVRTTYKTSEKIAFACESVSDLEESEDLVTTMLVLRDENGNVVDYYTGEEIWNNMWSRNKFVGELLRTPEEPGEYTLEIYFNGKRVKTDKDVSFTVT
ncbi:MAG: fibronectin type III domain-containing protein, partial [Lachnospiraceae bacterium]|nr:fibronectin type III domain-containing protein [Lachnospiraceae bacterium]